MSKNEKMWALLVHLGTALWPQHVYDELNFDMDVWNKIVDACVEYKYNTIIIDIAEGLQYESHPEIAVKGAWSKEKMASEVKRLKDLGITLIPKINLSAMHDLWLGEYDRMVSTKTYYKLCKDLIEEAYELFDKPEYIHLGMDEEDLDHTATPQMVLVRQHDLLWHDLKYLFDCVRNLGATPWIWSDPCFDHFDDFAQRFGVEDVVLSPWQYNALKEEHYTPISSRQIYAYYYAQPKYQNMDIKYVEDDPFLVKYRTMAPKCIEKGYKLFPCMSDCNECGDINCMDTLEYYKERADETTPGYVMAPWLITTKDNEEAILKNIRQMAEARDKIYN